MNNLRQARLILPKPTPIQSHHDDYARELAQRGFVVLAPDACGFGERVPSVETCTRLMTAAMLLGKTLVGMRVWDAWRAIDYLGSRPEVDPLRIAYVGLSWGGAHTIYTTALDPRIKLAVLHDISGRCQR